MTTDWIETFSGRRFRPTKPDVRQIDIMDIAHALSMKARFSGHCRKFYSVAHHSVIVSTLVPEEYALEGLLHDAAEAYVPDIPRPLRTLYPGMMEIEDGVHRAVAERFGTVYPLPPPVKEADNRVLVDEARELMHSGGEEWGDFGWDYGPYGYGLLIRPVPPKESRDMFIKRYDELIELREVDDPWHFKAIMRERRNK